MKHAIWMLMPCLLLVTGCISNNSKPDATMESPKKVNAVADEFVEKQRWGDARSVLKRGLKRFPNDPVLKQKLDRVTQQWQGIKQRYEDWILVYETEGMLLKRPVLERMVQSDSGDYLLKSRLLFLDSLLSAKQTSLISCAKHQQAVEIGLAARCAKAANRISPTRDGSALLADIQQRQNEYRQARQKRRKQIAAKTLADQRKRELELAHWQMSSSFYSEAVKTLSPLLEQNPEDAEVRTLLEQAKIGRDQQVSQLIRHGDQLYREEHIQRAVAIWEQAASLDPEHSGIAQRIDRAKRILDNLNQIRGSDKAGAGSNFSE